MNKKGFTLVELLAVIVILAIIAVITIPMISNVIEKSKLGTMEDSAYGLIEAANYYYAEHMNEMSSNKLFVIENGVQTSEEKLNYKGNIEGNAKVLLASNGKVALCLTSGKSYAKKEITDTKVIMNTVSSDTTCEINGLESDSDITIDISGSNSSYYDKNEIDDKLNDIRNDLTNYVTKDEFNDNLNNLNNVSKIKIESRIISSKEISLLKQFTLSKGIYLCIGRFHAYGGGTGYVAITLLGRIAEDKFDVAGSGSSMNIISDYSSIEVSKVIEVTQDTPINFYAYNDGSIGLNMASAEVDIIRLK